MHNVIVTAPPPAMATPILTPVSKRPSPMRRRSLEDKPPAPRSISHNSISHPAKASGSNNGLPLDTISVGSGDVSHISEAEPTRTAASTDAISVGERYSANLELAPTKPVNLDRDTEVFELADAFSDIGPLASWYREFGEGWPFIYLLGDLPKY